MPISSERLKELAESRCERTHYEGFRCLICDAKEMARELLERREADHTEWNNALSAAENHVVNAVLYGNDVVRAIRALKKEPQ